MNILLTSGGTQIPIDTVRHIGNMSRGTTGCLLAQHILATTSHPLTFLTSRLGKSPFKLEVDVTNFDAYAQAPVDVEQLRELYNARQDTYREVKYSTFDEYAVALQQQCERQPDVVILAAAVSDYGCEPVSGKVRSGAALTIPLLPLPKLISRVKQWAPKTRLVGYKLLVGASKEELIAAARVSCVNNGCEFVVANDWNAVTKGRHNIYLVDKDKTEEVKWLDPFNHSRAILTRLEK